VLPRIERYEITNEIGHGGMATVYRARDTRLDRWVAVKVMHPHLRGTEQARLRFSREARAVARLRHPAILEIYDYSGNDSENAYIATELLTGPTLRGFMEQAGEVPAEIAACIGAELANALAAAHAHGIIHRDVKPENVLLHEDRTVKLTDFGIADMLDPSMSAMTATGQLLGSPAHMAPEQVEMGDADARSDVFALGTILYWLATGSLPFTGKNPHQVLKRVVDCKPADPLTLRPSMGRPLRNVICRCLEKAPEDRYQTADQLATALRELLVMVGIDDPRATLSAYLHDPKGEGPRLQTRVLTALIEQARKAVVARDRLRAIDLLDRALALQDGHSEALKLLAQLDRSARVRRYLRVAIAISVAAGAALLWVANAPRSGAVSDRREPPKRATVVASQPATSPARNDVVGEPASADATDASARAAQDEAKVATLPSVPKPSERGAQPSPELEADASRSRPRDLRPRLVKFYPEPANVTISVNGAEPRAFGPSFREIELSPGLHSFRFVGAHECCRDAVIELDVPSGPGETPLHTRLEFREAQLYVRSNVPANVQVADGRVSGRTFSLLRVPMQKTLIERQRVSVTAEGYQPYTQYVQVQAGKVTELPITLKPSAPP
jgi:eukaryotic-like serine/threonine-protein kinase